MSSINVCWCQGDLSIHSAQVLSQLYNDRVWLALEYKGIDYDTMFINLRDKPEWFLELVPTGLVPVAKVKDDLVHESYDILKVCSSSLWNDWLFSKTAFGESPNSGGSGRQRNSHCPQRALVPAAKVKDDLVTFCTSPTKVCPWS